MLPMRNKNDSSKGMKANIGRFRNNFSATFVNFFINVYGHRNKRI